MKNNLIIGQIKNTQLLKMVYEYDLILANTKYLFLLKLNILNNK